MEAAYFVETFVSAYKTMGFKNQKHQSECFPRIYVNLSSFSDFYK
jgi:hypothetical protein